MWEWMGCRQLRACGRTWLHHIGVCLQSQTLLPIVGEPPGGPPNAQHGDGDATLTWRGAPAAEGTTLEASLLAVLQFVAGKRSGLGMQKRINMNASGLQRSSSTY